MCKVDFTFVREFSIAAKFVILILIRAAVWLKILIAINHTIKIFNHQNKKHKFVAQNSSIIHYVTNIAQCKSQQNVLPTEIKIKTSN